MWVVNPESVNAVRQEAEKAERYGLKWFCTTVLPRCEYAGDCLVWKGGVTEKGYARYGKGGGRLSRLVVAVSTGRLPEAGEVVRHTCDNPPCVHPGHLAVGTPAENSRDMVSRGRSTKRLTKSDESTVLALLRKGLTQHAVAEVACCSQSAVSVIKRNGEQEC